MSAAWHLIQTIWTFFNSIPQNRSKLKLATPIYPGVSWVNVSRNLCVLVENWVSKSRFPSKSNSLSSVSSISLVKLTPEVFPGCFRWSFLCFSLKNPVFQFSLWFFLVSPIGSRRGSEPSRAKPRASAVPQRASVGLEAQPREDHVLHRVELVRNHRRHPHQTGLDTGKSPAATRDLLSDKKWEDSDSWH